LILAAVLGIHCVTGAPDPPRFCVDIRASDRLNSFEDEPHVVVLAFYPLRSDSGFRAMDPKQLIDGAAPPGTTGDRWELTVLPGEHRELEETLPRDTGWVGVLADFYRGPSREIVAAGCPRFGRTALVLSHSDLQTE
jgi:type VI secretion system VasD/TssJ family lipoprotein